MADSPALRLPADRSVVKELFALLAYGFIVAAFYVFTGEARMALGLLVRISMASIAAVEMGHYALLRDALELRGVDRSVGDVEVRVGAGNYHWLTTPGTWLEALVKANVDDSLASDLLFGRSLGGLPG
ncbi:hypothetical protein A8144_01065 [Mycobacterium leprae 3125609]|nr:hypothetical protein A8144_01065 [Mycobacterium leprae 3125609]OAX72344.1 hypothetical protein A3216_01145 [Mycobacterium leprae 7935681]